jgi:two-component system, OmpR family, response regulator
MENEKKTILVVDDDIDYLYQQKIQLEAAGYNVLTAEGMVGAEEILQDTLPDLAVVDLMMEELDGGFTLCHRIKKKDPAIPIIMVTAVASETGMEFDTATEEERSWLKADALLDKPVLFEQLNREIKRLLK